MTNDEARALAVGALEHVNSCREWLESDDRVTPINPGASRYDLRRIDALAAALIAALDRLERAEELLHPLRRAMAEADYYCPDDVDDEHRVLPEVTVGELRAVAAYFKDTDHE